jgi:DNA-binding winged helix-turn-helix (wHTH) protein
LTGTVVRFDEPARRVVGSEHVTNGSQNASTPNILRFGIFELDNEAEQLSRNGRIVRLQPKPFKLLCLLAGQAGKLVTREDIQKALWKADTFVDFEQGVNFAIKQVREALGEDADRPMYIQTVPKRGYRFVAPVDRGPAPAATTDAVYRPPATDGSLNKLLWTHIAELKVAESRRQKRRKVMMKLSAIAAVVVLALIAAFFALR